MKPSLSLFAPLLLFLAIQISASPHPAGSPPPRSVTLSPRHDDPDCDSAHTYTTTYTSDIVRTYTLLSVSTATETYTSLRTMSTRRAPRPHGTRTTTQTETWTEVKTQTQTVTDWAPGATVTVTKTQTDTDTDTAVRTQTAVSISTVSAAAPSASPSPGGECDTGSLQCCDTVAPANSPAMSGILSAIGVAVDVLGGGLVGTSCSPISALSLGGGVECNQNPVCCNNNTYQGLINIGCVPIQL